MEDKYKELINFIQKYDDKYVTSKILSSYFCVTTRTIRNRVRQINKTAKKDFIKSNNRGYYIEDNDLIKFSNDTLKGRKDYILINLLKKSDNELNIYELSDELFISESTLRSDLKALQEELIDNLITIDIKPDRVILIGNEEEKRKYILSLLSSEINSRSNMKEIIQNMLGYIKIFELEELISTILQKNYGIKKNQYTINNIAMHFAVSIERIRQGNIIQHFSIDKKHIENEFNIAYDIVKEVELKFYIKFPYEEILKLSLLFLDNSTNNDIYKRFFKDNLDSIEKKVTRILQEIHRVYLIDLNDKDFYDQFLLHVQNLLLRAMFNTYERNNSLIEIKMSYPLIYDISVYIANLIEEIFNIKLPEGEISFLALHVGSVVYEKRKLEEDISILVVADDYINIRKNLENDLKDILNSNYYIISKTNLIEEDINNFDIIISTKKYQYNYDNIIYINPFIINQDLAKITNEIDRISKNREIEEFIIDFKKYISPDLFFYYKSEFDKPKDLIINLCLELSKQKLVNDDFYKDVLKREELSSTSFPSGVATPHSLYTVDSSSKIVICILENGLKWNNIYIKLVLMPILGKYDIKRFNNFFQNIIILLSEPINVKKLENIASYDKFRETFINIYKNQT